MKLNLSRKGFTLVEIMIVVVIIGLLAALAIPAFKKVRNTTIEKTLFNDAKQLSSGFNQFTIENAASTTTLNQIVGSGKFVATLSSGTLLTAEGGKAAANLTTAANLWTALLLATGNSNVVIAALSDSEDFAKSCLSIGNTGYDAGLSSKSAIATSYEAGTNYLTFSMETGQLLTKAYTPALNTAPTAAEVIQ